MPDPETSTPRFDSLAYTLARYRGITPRLACDPTARDDAEVNAWMLMARAKLRELIGPFPEERVALNPSYGEPTRKDGYSRRALTFDTRHDLSAFGYLLIPDGARTGAPAVFCVPGHGRGVDEIVGIDDEGKDRDHLDGYQHDFAVQCVRQGYVTLAIEPLGFGRRRDPAARASGAGRSSCQPAAGAALMLGETMIGWRTWDAMRALDLLASRPEVDPKRMAMMGISGGGTVTMYTAALDDRVKAAVLSGSFCTFKDSIFSLSHCIDNYVPDILTWFEAADLAGLIAPRALFVENGKDDLIFPQSGVDAALAVAREIYQGCGVPDQIDHASFDGGHQFDGTAAFRRLKDWL
jgi:dienelactone hydrolase